MKKVTLIATVVLTTVLVSFTTVDSTKWSLDKAHAKLGFTLSHLTVSDVEGFFKSFTATITATKSDFSDAVVEMSAEVKSVDTDNTQRDEHIKSPDFLDVAKYPTIEFKSTSFKKSKVANTYILKGNLTMHGITKPVILKAIAKTGINPMSNQTIAGFKISGTVKRSDFGIGGAIPSAMVGEDISIFANAEFAKK